MKESNYAFGALEEPDVEALMRIGTQQQLHVSDRSLTSQPDAGSGSAVSPVCLEANSRSYLPSEKFRSAQLPSTCSPLPKVQR